MKTLNLVQGSPEWLAERAKHFTASEAPIMMGASPKAKRNELLCMKSTGDEKEFSRWVRDVLFKRGHEIEVLARPIAEKIIGDELYPVTGIEDDGDLLASFDGLTMLGDVIWECKQWNEAKAADVRGGACPEEDYWQVVQQLVVSGAERCLYMVTDGTEEKTVYCWVSLKADDEARLRGAWDQFNQDLADYQPPEQEVIVAAAPVVDLPAVSVQVSGAIEVADNFKTFEIALRDFIDNKLIRKPQTDQDFADLDTQIKSLKKAEAALEAAEAQMLSQLATVDAAKRTKDMLHALARDNRLMAEKLLDAEKKNRRNEILAGGKEKLRQHIEQVNKTFSKVRLPEIPADFAGVMKGKRNISSLQDAVDTELARAKIEASQIADRMRVNVATLQELCSDHDYGFLFGDLQQICTKPAEDFAALAKLRIAEHKQAEEKRLEAEREKIREEEKQKAEAAAKAEAEKQRQEDAAKAREEANAIALECAQASKVEPSKPDAQDQQFQQGVVASESYQEEQETKNRSASAALDAIATTEQPKAAQSIRPAIQSRPADEQIIGVLALHYRVHESKVIEWLLEMDLSAQSEKLASNF